MQIYAIQRMPFPAPLGRPTGAIPHPSRRSGWVYTSYISDECREQYGTQSCSSCLMSYVQYGGCKSLYEFRIQVGSVLPSPALVDPLSSIRTQMTQLGVLAALALFLHSIWRLLRDYFLKSSLDVIPGPAPQSIISGSYFSSMVVRNKL